MKMVFSSWSDCKRICYCCTKQKKDGEIGLSERARMIKWMINIKIAIIMCLYICVCVWWTVHYMVPGFSQNNQTARVIDIIWKWFSVVEATVREYVIAAQTEKDGEIGKSERARTIERMINIKIAIIMYIYIFVCRWWILHYIVSGCSQNDQMALVVIDINIVWKEI